MNRASDNSQAVAKRVRHIDEAFARTGDPWHGLLVARLAMEHGLPVPPATAAWLCDAFSKVRDPIHDRDDKVIPVGVLLGLEGGRGAGSPARRMVRREIDECDYFLMKGWYELGATVTDAAELVRSKSRNVSVDTLVKTWKRARRLDGQPPVRGSAIGSTSFDEVIGLLAEVPDTEENKSAKLGIVKAFK